MQWGRAQRTPGLNADTGPANVYRGNSRYESLPSDLNEPDLRILPSLRCLAPVKVLD
ncbi:MAG: hypothetical protein IIC96_12725 [Chloroflexi bacterium]|nr:hypothetical protein [Chloroflexota bacterium]